MGFDGPVQGRLRFDASAAVTTADVCGGLGAEKKAYFGGDG